MDNISININESTKEVTIENLTVTNPEIYNFLVERDRDTLDEWVTKALVIGCVGLKQMILTDNIDYVEKKFNEFIHQAQDAFENHSTQMSEKIDKTFSLDDTTSPLYQMQKFILEYFNTENGKFKTVIDDYFNQDDGEVRKLLDQSFDLTNTESSFSQLMENIKEISGKDEDTIKDMLDPHKTDSPAEKLKKEIFTKFLELKERDINELMKSIQDIRDKELKDIRDALLKTKAIEDEKQKGTAKGLEFEELAYDALEEMASVNGDIVERVGDVSTKAGKKGDILIDVDGDRTKRIVIECKDSSNYNPKKVKDEINEALENRDGSYGIFLFAKQEQMPTSLIPIKITDSYIVTCMENENLYFAYRLAKIYLDRAQDKGSAINTAEINREIEKIVELLQNFSTIQGKVTQIINSGEYLRTNLQHLHDNIEFSINRIQSYCSA